MRGPVDPESRRRLLRMAWQGTGAAMDAGFRMPVATIARTTAGVQPAAAAISDARRGTPSDKNSMIFWRCALCLRVFVSDISPSVSAGAALGGVSASGALSDIFKTLPMSFMV